MQAVVEVLKFLLALVAVVAALAVVVWVILALEPYGKLIREIVTGCFALVVLLGALGGGIYVAATEGWVAGIVVLVGFVVVVGLLGSLFKLVGGVSFLLFDLPRVLREQQERERAARQRSE
ncbi:hypothetical protein [Nitrospira sp. Kam-Ns4a]